MSVDSRIVGRLAIGFRDQKYIDERNYAYVSRMHWWQATLFVPVIAQSNVYACWKMKRNEKLVEKQECVAYASADFSESHRRTCAVTDSRFSVLSNLIPASSIVASSSCVVS